MDCGLGVFGPLRFDDADFNAETQRRKDADSLRAYKIKLDGVVVGSVRARESVTVPVAPGRHSLVLLIDWCGSEQIDFESQPGEHLCFECGSSLVGWRVLLALFYIVFRTH